MDALLPIPPKRLEKIPDYPLEAHELDALQVLHDILSYILSPLNEKSTIEGVEMLCCDEKVSSSCASPGMFWYTEQMPVIIKCNIHVSLGIANGKEAKALGFVINPESTVHKIESGGTSEIYLGDRPPACLLVQVSNLKHGTLEGLPNNLFPVHPSMLYWKEGEVEAAVFPGFRCLVHQDSITD